MKTEILSVYDMAAQRYIDPFPAPTIDFAIRGFKEACQTDGHNFNKFPEDYALYHIATFDAILGDIVPTSPHKVATASNFFNTVRHSDQTDLENQISSQIHDGVN